jgi:hypothetical protein
MLILREKVRPRKAELGKDGFGRTRGEAVEKELAVLSKREGKAISAVLVGGTMGGPASAVGSDVVEAREQLFDRDHGRPLGKRPGCGRNGRQPEEALIYASRTHKPLTALLGSMVLSST